MAITHCPSDKTLAAKPRRFGRAALLAAARRIPDQALRPEHPRAGPEPKAPTGINARPAIPPVGEPTEPPPAPPEGPKKEKGGVRAGDEPGVHGHAAPTALNRETRWDDSEPATGPTRDPHWIETRYPGTCPCNNPIRVDDRVFQYPNGTGASGKPRWPPNWRAVSVSFSTATNDGLVTHLRVGHFHPALTSPFAALGADGGLQSTSK